MMSRILIGSMLGTTAFMFQGADPAISVLEDELLRAMPGIAAAKAQMEGMIGRGVGPEVLLVALFIVFCGRQVMTLLTKAFDMWADERKERLAEQRADRREAREERARRREQDRDRGPDRGHDDQDFRSPPVAPVSPPSRTRPIVRKVARQGS